MKTKIIAFVLIVLIYSSSICFALETNGKKMPVPNIIPVPTLRLELTDSKKPEDISTGLKILFLMTVIALAPSILIMMTSFTRIMIILSFTRRALAVQTTPPNQILAAIAMFLTFYIMSPVWKEANENALQPYFKKEITQEVAIQRFMKPIRKFMFAQTRESDLALFTKIARNIKPKTRDDIPIHVLVPAFVISELKTGFTMGLIIFIPFLVIDMVVASTLMSMGMIMLPPVMISMPFKLLLFVMVDGWSLIIQSIMVSFK